MSIDEFTGRNKRFGSIPPVLTYRHSVGNKKTWVNRSVSVDSARKSTSSIEPPSAAREGFDEHLGVHGGAVNGIYKTLALSPSPQPPEFLTPVDAEHETLHREQGEQIVIKVPINSNPLVPETTGFEGDSNLPFFTPSSSIEDSEEVFDSDDKEPAQHRSRVGDGKAAAPKGTSRDSADLQVLYGGGDGDGAGILGHCNGKGVTSSNQRVSAEEQVCTSSFQTLTLATNHSGSQKAGTLAH